MLLTQVSNAYSSERLLEAQIGARAEYHDNLFLVNEAHDSVVGVVVTPLLSGVAKEEHWEARLNASLGLTKYSDHDLDSNDQFFNLTGRYLAQRNIFSLNINHSLTSNLSTTSEDFGIARTRIQRKTQGVSPQYTRLLTERSTFSLSYVYTDVDFLNSENTNFTPFVSQTGTGTLQYNLTEKDTLSLSLQAVDYESSDKLVTYQLFVSRFSIDHAFSETLSSNFQIGVSRQSSTSLITEEFDFFGNIIIRAQEIDAENRGLVLNAGITQLLEKGSVNGRISRDNTTNSFGGLDEINKFEVSHINKLSALWRYNVNGSYSEVTSISSSSSTIDRNILSLEAVASYSINANWRFSASYRYLQRRFKSDTSGNKAPHSNRVFVSLTYNLPSLSTF